MTDHSSPSTSEPPRRWAWIGGWGLPTTSLLQVVNECWPQDSHEIFPPDSHAVSRAHDPSFHIVAGYSLGALLLLSSAPDQLTRPHLAIAPILAFDAEAGRGGVTPQKSRLAVASRFQRSPSTALRLYLRLAGLSDLASSELPYSLDGLAWGLASLGTAHARSDCIAQSQLFLGTNDPLVDASKVSTQISHLKCLPELNHDFRTLIPAVSSRYKASNL